ncbi:MAG TPA: hypothetical protein VM901_13725 [Bdellovibrionota bacterium]|jgi:hypothetical protein|nr:hypothetical protein [Bdellovibrionota bacterium]
MKSKLFQSSYFGFLSLLVVAPTAHAALTPDDPRVVHKPSYLRDLRLEADFLDQPFIVQKSELNITREPLSENAPLNLVAKARPEVQLPQTMVRMPSPIPQQTIASRARVIAVDAQELNFGRIVPIATAEATWMGNDSRLQSRADNNGVMQAPYKNTRAQRFVVKANGYIPAVGYAVMGSVSVALMYRSELEASFVADQGSGSHVIIGKVLDKDLRPVPGLKIESSDTNARVDYSVGTLGLFQPEFMPRRPASDVSGDFVVNGLDESIQYLIPSSSDEAELWPVTAIDLSGLPRVVSLAIPKVEKVFAKTSIRDVYAQRRPAGQVIMTIAGQTGEYIPEDDGKTLIENLFPRPAMDVMEIWADSYLKTWVHAPANPALMPPVSPMLTEQRVQEILDTSSIHWSASESLVIGKVAAHGGFEVRVMGPDGKRATDAMVIYFDANGEVNPELTTTAENREFMVLGLGDGEWNLLTVNPAAKVGPTGEPIAAGVGGTIVRTAAGVMSVVEL